MDFVQANWLAITGAALAAYVFGALWYALLGDLWLSAIERTERQLQTQTSPVIPFLTALISALISAAGLTWLFEITGVTSLLDALTLASALGLLIVSPWIITHYGFSERPVLLWCIDCGHTILSLICIGAVLFLLR
ncbi:MAG: DUF1761 domain-containing protein [Neomegalonema sp.]|nr:DUF1761 domain-containing protein [Neomegalonema sp.]